MTYVETEFGPAFKMFQCDAFRASLTMKGCAARWIEAQTAKGYDGDRLAPCRGCAIGAAHAGREHIHYSRHHASPICPRCGRFATRMIKNEVCISCYNREREMRTGRNSRGNVPVKLLERPLGTFELLVEVNGQVRRLRAARRIAITEAVVQFLRTHTGRPAFAYAAPGAGQIRSKLRELRDRPGPGAAGGAQYGASG